jgi:hypothetical protein
MTTKYDIHFQPVPPDEATSTRLFTFGFRASLKVSGPQALVNRWVKTLMTPKGSNPLDKSEGTAFGRLVGANVSMRSRDIDDVLILAIEDANDQVRQQDLVGMFPSNERLANATLIEDQSRSWEDGFEIGVRIVNLAGQVLPTRLMDLADR